MTVNLFFVILNKSNFSARSFAGRYKTAEVRLVGTTQ